MYIYVFSWERKEKDPNAATKSRGGKTAPGPSKEE
jgi:hypothetical protein